MPEASEMAGVERAAAAMESAAVVMEMAAEESAVAAEGGGWVVSLAARWRRPVGSRCRNPRSQSLSDTCPRLRRDLCHRRTIHQSPNQAFRCSRCCKGMQVG